MHTKYARTRLGGRWVDHVVDMVFVGLHVKYLDGVLQSDFLVRAK